MKEQQQRPPMARARTTEGTMHCSECGIELEPHEIDGVCENCEAEDVLEDLVVADARRAAVMGVVFPAFMLLWALFTLFTQTYSPETWPYATWIWIPGAFSCIGSPMLIFGTIGAMGAAGNAAGAAHRLAGLKEYEGLARVAHLASRLGLGLSGLAFLAWVAVPIWFFLSGAHGL